MRALIRSARGRSSTTSAGTRANASARWAQPDSPDLASPHPSVAIAAYKTAHDVGAARDRREMNVGFDRAIHVIEAFGRQRRAGRADGTNAAQIVRGFRLEARLSARVEEPGGRAEHRHARSIDHVEEAGSVWVGGGPVLQNNRGTG